MRMPDSLVDRVKAATAGKTASRIGLGSQKEGDRAAPSRRDTERFKTGFAQMVFDLVREQSVGVFGFDVLRDLGDLEPLLPLCSELIPVLLRPLFVSTATRGFNVSDVGTATVQRGRQHTGLNRVASRNVRQQIASRVDSALQSYSQLTQGQTLSSQTLSLQSLSLSGSWNSPVGRNYIRSLLANVLSAGAVGSAGSEQEADGTQIPQPARLSRKFLTLCSTALSSSSAASRKRDAVDFILLQELFEEESSQRWCSFEADEVRIKLQVADLHLLGGLLLQDTVLCVQSLLPQIRRRFFD